MSEPPPFDTTRAAFYLVASMISVHALTIVTSDIQCWLAERMCNEVVSSLRDLMTETMATALAFSRLGSKP